MLKLFQQENFRRISLIQYNILSLIVLFLILSPLYFPVELFWACSDAGTITCQLIGPHLLFFHGRTICSIDIVQYAKFTVIEEINMVVL